MPYYVGEIIGGSLPILFVAWIILKLSRQKWNGTIGAVYSVLAAGVISFVLASIGNADGAPVIAYIFSFRQLPMTIGSTILALLTILFWGSTKTKSDTP